MNRALQIVLIVSTVLASWLGMQAVHELGHVLGSRITGGTVNRVVLHPLTISRTDVGENPQPLAVAWAGPILGAVVPVVLWSVAAVVRMPGAFVLRFFAGFCLMANGSYIGAGSFTGVGDCGDLLRHGAAIWHLWLFGIVAAPLGVLLWHNQGKHFGLGRDSSPVSPRVAIGCLFIFLALLVLALVVDGH